MTKKVVRTTNDTCKQVMPKKHGSKQVEETKSKPSEEPEETAYKTIYKGQATQDTSDTDGKNTMMIVLGPSLQFLLHDATLGLGLALSLAFYPTVKNYDLIMANQIPMSVVMAWLLVTFAAGYQLAMWRSVTGIAQVDELDIDVGPISEEIAVSGPPQEPEGYRVLNRVARRLSMHSVIIVKKPPPAWPTNVWSALGEQEGQKVPEWQRKGHEPVSPPLMNRLLGNPMYTRRDDVVDPLFTLLGMDIFVTDSAEESMSQHPFLIKYVQ